MSKCARYMFQNSRVCFVPSLSKRVGMLSGHTKLKVKQKHDIHKVRNKCYSNQQKCNPMQANT